MRIGRTHADRIPKTVLFQLPKSTLPALLFPPAQPLAQDFCHLPSDTHQRIHGRDRILRDPADAIASDLIHFFLGKPGKIISIIKNASCHSRIFRKKTHDGRAQDRFPAPRLANQRSDFSPVKEKIYITKHADSAHRRKESDRKLLHFDIHRKGSFQVREWYRF